MAATVRFQMPESQADHEVTSNNAEHEDSALDSDSEPDNEHVLQIFFDAQVQANRRRKSSLVDTQGNDTIEPSSSSCFVHTLLENRRHMKGEPGGIGASQIDRNFNGIEEKIKDCNVTAAMTKRELSEMVLGVRELSKHLASVSIRMRVKTLFILTKPDRHLVRPTRQLTAWLLSKRYTVYVDEAFKDNTEFDAKGLTTNERDSRHLRYWTPQICKERPHTFDFVITLGGDGTVLYASWLFQKVVPPVFSFALGTLGFLTKHDFSNYQDTLIRTFNAGITVALRLRFEATIMQALPKEGVIREERDLCTEILSAETNATHHPVESHAILNEIVVDRGPNATMSTTELYGDDMFLTQIAADGVCIATPTGSTAYNLAAGGSLCHPEIPGMMVCAICAHSLTFRPLILPDSMVLRIGVPFDARTTAWVSFDGRKRTELQQGDYVSVIASRFPFPTVQSERDHKDWFESIRRTMNWGVRGRGPA